MGINNKNKKNGSRKNRKRYYRKSIDMDKDLDLVIVRDITVNAKEHKILKKYSKMLQERFRVRMAMPRYKIMDTDVVFVSIKGRSVNIDRVEKFLNEKRKESTQVDSDVILVSSDSESEEEISVIDLESDEEAKSEQTLQLEAKKKKMKVSDEDATYEPSNFYEVTSTTHDDKEPCTSKPLEDFIPLVDKQKNECESAEKNSVSNKDESVIIIEPESTTPRRLRPIVIDGSNVAMEHGRASKVFSTKGIKLAVDYFKKRGHTHIVAFVPRFRRCHNPNRAIPTTDVELFDELMKDQHVVFTPSRRIRDKNISCYDDRFIVEHAAKHGGVVVSNDNFRDLLNENESFKETIEQRLLMYLFVQDEFMVPDDPLGKKGPRLNDFLSFPSEESKPSSKRKMSDSE